MSAPRFGLRVGPGYPWKQHRGDIIHLGNSTREQVEDIREQMTTGKWHEIVELDQNGNVIA